MIQARGRYIAVGPDPEPSLALALIPPASPPPLT